MQHNYFSPPFLFNMYICAPMQLNSVRARRLLLWGYRRFARYWWRPCRCRLHWGCVRANRNCASSSYRWAHQACKWNLYERMYVFAIFLLFRFSGWKKQTVNCDAGSLGEQAWPHLLGAAHGDRRRVRSFLFFIIHDPCSLWLSKSPDTNSVPYVYRSQLTPILFLMSIEVTWYQLSDIK